MLCMDVRLRVCACDHFDDVANLAAWEFKTVLLLTALNEQVLVSQVCPIKT